MIQQEEDVQIPVPELLGALLEKGGSDLHLTAGSPPMVRVHGELEPAGEYPQLTPRALQGMVYAILPQKLRERFEQELELDMSYSLPGRSRFRVNVFQQRDALGADRLLMVLKAGDAEEHIGLVQAAELAAAVGT